MIKKITIVCMMFFMVLSLTGCSSDSEDEKKEPTNDSEQQQPREFTESNGIIKYITIEDEKIAIPETIGEYVGYLEKLGNVEFGDSKKLMSEMDQMEPNEIASMASVLNVYTKGSDYHEFGINYFNPKDKKIDVKDASVSRITLIYDIYSELEEDLLLDSIVLITEKGEIAIDGKTTSADIMKILGAPVQNTDGYLKYTDDAGFTYKFATENKKGILTKVQIDYPKN